LSGGLARSVRRLRWGRQGRAAVMVGTNGYRPRRFPARSSPDIGMPVAQLAGLIVTHIGRDGEFTTTDTVTAICGSSLSRSDRQQNPAMAQDLECPGRPAPAHPPVRPTPQEPPGRNRLAGSGLEQVVVIATGGKTRGPTGPHDLQPRLAICVRPDASARTEDPPSPGGPGKRHRLVSGGESSAREAPSASGERYPAAWAMASRGAMARQTAGKSRSTPASTSCVATRMQGSPSATRRRTSSRTARRCAGQRRVERWRAPGIRSASSR